MSENDDMYNKLYIHFTLGGTQCETVEILGSNYITMWSCILMVPTAGCSGLLNPNQTDYRGYMRESPCSLVGLSVMVLLAVVVLISLANGWGSSGCSIVNILISRLDRLFSYR